MAGFAFTGSVVVADGSVLGAAKLGCAKPAAEMIRAKAKRAAFFIFGLQHFPKSEAKRS